MPDPVNHPAHYQSSRFESIQVIEAYRLGFHLGNAFKYIARHKKKGGKQDLEKAVWYLLRFLEREDVRQIQLVAWDVDGDLGFSESIEEIADDFGLSENLREGLFHIIALIDDWDPQRRIRAAIEKLQAEIKEGNDAPLPA